MTKDEKIFVDYLIFHEEEESPLDKLRRVSGAAAEERLRWLPYDYAQQPWLYFISDGNYLKCLGTNDSIPCHGEYFDSNRIPFIEKIYPHLFSPDPTSPNATPIYQEIAISLGGRKFTSYYNTLMNFKWNAGLRSFPLFDLQSNIQVVDGRLWGMVDNNGALCWKLLTDRIVNQEIKRWGGHTCTSAKIIQNLAKELLWLHAEQNTQDENPSKIDVATPYFHLSYSSLLNQAEVVRLNGFRFHIASPTSSLRNFLRSIADESKNRLDDFAELLVRLYMPDLASKYLWVIKGDAPQTSKFLQLLQDLGAYTPGSAIYETGSTKALISFVYDQAKKCNVQVNSRIGNSISFKDVNRSRLIKFVSGEVIGSIDDPYIINGEVTGKGALLYVAQELDENCLKKIPYKVIRISDECQFSKITADDCWWLQTCLLCHGLHLLSMSEAEPTNDALSLDQALRKFVRSFCEIRAGVWTDRKHFYGQFKRYCDICVAVEGKIPGPNIFAHYVEDELCWSSIVPRSNKNRSAFDGVALDDDKLERAIQEAQEHRISQPGQADSDNFDAYVDSFKGYLRSSEQQMSSVRFSI